MKLFREINSKLDTILKSIEDEKSRRDKWERNKEKMLFETIDEKEELLKDKILLKDTLNVKEKLNGNLEEDVEKQKETIKNLTNEVKVLKKYKRECEDLKKEVKRLEKEIKRYDENGVVIPQRLAPAVPRKGQRIKETVRPVKK